MKIERMNKGSWGKVRAFFDLTTSEGFTMKGFKIIEGINGLFVLYIGRMWLQWVIGKVATLAAGVNLQSLDDAEAG